MSNITVVGRPLSDWYAMPIREPVTRSSCFIVDVTTQKVIATAFLVTIRSDSSGLKHGYLVTAAHCIDGLPESETVIRLRTATNQVIDQPLLGTWKYPVEGYDLAVLPFHHGNQSLFAIPMREALDVLEHEPKLGASVYFIGLLAPVKSMALFGVPMVRTATLGALNVPGVTHSKWSEPMTVHLIDTRSRSGFSGSPVLYIYPAPGPREHDQWLPWASDDDQDKYGTLYFYNSLLGLFVAHEDDARVGVVIPVERIREALDYEEFVTMRKKADQEALAKEAKKSGFEAQSEMAKPFGRDDFLTDLRRVTRRTDTSQPDPEDPKTSA